MSMYVITGVPGAGKSYYAMSKISKLLESNDDFLIISNINGTDTRIEDNRYIFNNFQESDFVTENFEKYVADLRKANSLPNDSIILIFIDEAQRYFGPRQKNQSIIYTFDYHRHLGVDIYLLTQHNRKLSKEIYLLADYEIRAYPPTLSIIPGCFSYKKSLGNEKFGTEKVKKRPQVFSLYKSFDAGKVKKHRPTILLKLLIPLLIFLLAFGKFWYSRIAPKEAQANESDIVLQQQEIQTNVTNVARQESVKQREEMTYEQIKSALDNKKYEPKKTHLEDYFTILSYRDWKIEYIDTKTQVTYKEDLKVFLQKYPSDGLESTYLATEDKLHYYWIYNGKPIMIYPIKQHLPPEKKEQNLQIPSVSMLPPTMQ